MKLYSYQEELVNSKSDRILINWCRGAGKDFGVAMYILENKPSSVYVDASIYIFIGIIESIKEVSLKYNLTVEEIDRQIIKLIFNDTNETVIIRNNNGSEKVYDLVITDYFWGEEYKAKKVIKSMTVSINSYYEHEKMDHKIVVDYKEALKENAIGVHNLIDTALNDQEEFYRVYAIKDKDQRMSFDSFKDQAIQRLQKQFLDTNDSKDTVLTRKNIIEMIKDLKEIN